LTNKHKHANVLVVHTKTKRINTMSLFSRTDAEPTGRPSKLRKYGGPAVAALLITAATGATELSTAPVRSNSTPTTVSIDLIPTTADTLPESVPVDVGAAIVTPDGQTGADPQGSTDQVRFGEGAVTTDTSPAVAGGDPTQETNQNPMQIGSGSDYSIERPPVNPAG
jgi:hypothetical protein